MIKGGQKMQKIKIYAQKDKEGNLSYYTNLYRKDKDTDKKYFKKLRVYFRKGSETIGNITIKESSLTFGKVKMQMNLKDLNTNKMVTVEVPYTSYKLCIWEYEKTAEDIQKDEESKANGIIFIKEYKERQYNSTAISNTQESSINYTSSPELSPVEEDELDLPF